MRPYLFYLKSNFTQIEFHTVMSLKSKYAKRIYDILRQHKEEGEFHISIQDLRNRLDLYKKDHQEGLYTQFIDFKTNILDIPQRELSEYGDITFTYEAKKTGRRFTHLTFHIKQVEKSINLLSE